MYILYTTGFACNILCMLPLSCGGTWLPQVFHATLKKVWFWTPSSFLISCLAAGKFVLMLMHVLYLM